MDAVSLPAHKSSSTFSHRLRERWTYTHFLYSRDFFWFIGISEGKKKMWRSFQSIQRFKDSPGNNIKFKLGLWWWWWRKMFVFLLANQLLFSYKEVCSVRSLIWKKIELSWETLKFWVLRLRNFCFGFRKKKLEDDPVILQVGFEPRSSCFIF